MLWITVSYVKGVTRETVQRVAYEGEKLVLECRHTGSWTFTPEGSDEKKIIKYSEDGWLDLGIVITKDKTELSDSGRYVRGNCDISVIVLQDEHRPLLEFDVKLVGTVRPMGEIVMKWSIKNVVPFLKKRVKLRFWIGQMWNLDYDEDVIKVETTDLKGTKTYAINLREKNGQNLTASLSCWYIGGYSEYVEKELQIKYEELAIDQLFVDYSNRWANGINLLWNVTGLQEEEKVSFFLSVTEDERTVVHNYSTKDYKYEIFARKLPADYYAEVLPVAGNFTGFEKALRFHLDRREIRSLELQAQSKWLRQLEVTYYSPYFI